MAKTKGSKPKNILLDKSLELLKDKIEKSGKIEGVGTFETYFTTISLSKKKIFNETKKSLNYITKNIEGVEHIYFLEAINYYIGNIASNEDLSYNDKYRREVKSYIKLIRKALNYIESNFDEKHLLFYQKEYSIKKFVAKDNPILLSFLDELTQILNHFGFNKEADKFFMLKGKLELGFSRYLFFKKEKIILKEFYENGEYEVVNEEELNEIFKYYIIDEIFFKEYFTKLKKSLEKIEDIENYLNVLSILNKVEPKIVQSEIKKNRKYLEKYPKKIINKKQFEIDNMISKSINPEFKIEIFEIKTEKRILVNINSIEVASRLSRLL
jgi:hypothetical protein